jgi:predicted nuclease of predicted toxin-antitoxin system
MKFLVDECIGPTVARWLQKNNYDVISVYDDLPGIDDDSVLEKAFLETRILITCDKDFGEMIFKNKMQHCGVIFLRLIDERPSQKINVLDSILKNYAQELFCNFVVATEKGIRITKLFLNVQ